VASCPTIPAAESRHLKNAPSSNNSVSDNFLQTAVAIPARQKYLKEVMIVFLLSYLLDVQGHVRPFAWHIGTPLVSDVEYHLVV